MKKYVIAGFRLPVGTLLLAAALALGCAKSAEAEVRIASVSGNWNDTATWGGLSVPGTGDTVTNNASITVTIPAGYAAVCESLSFSAVNGASTLNLADSSASLTVSGAVTLPRKAGATASTINVGAGTFSAGSVSLQGTTGGRLCRILISTGTTTVSGNVTSAGLDSQIIFSDAGTWNAGGGFLSGVTGTFTNATGTVQYNRAGDQAIGPYRYNNLTLSGSGVKSIGTGTAVNGCLNIAPSGSAIAGLADGLNLAVPSLSLGGTGQSTGTWGSGSAPGATHQNDDYFAPSTGYLTVLNDSRPPLVIWRGNGDWYADAGNWVNGLPGPGSNVWIASGSVTLTNAGLPLAGITLGTLGVTNPATLVFSNWSTCLTASNVTVQSNGVMTLPTAFQENGPSNRVWVVCTNFTLNTGGKVLADARGYNVTNGLGKGASNSAGNGGGSGGGHGGKGGNSATKGGGIAYGSTDAPINPGSGGGNGASGAGGAGGGAVRIEAAGTVTIDGIISANGTNGTAGTWGGGGGGSGGSIFVAGGTVGGNNGSLLANGGTGGGSANGHLGGGGGGGRLVVAIGLSADDLGKLATGQEIPGLFSYEQDPAFHGTLSVTNGTGWTNLPPGGAASGTKQFLKVQGASQWSLTIVGDPAPYGTPSPNGYGTWTIADNSRITNAVALTADEADGMRWSCLGWQLTDTGQGTGITNETGVEAVLTVNTNMTLTWLWTNQYPLAFSAGPNGSVNSTERNGWYNSGTPVDGIEATPSNGYYFVAWVGADVPTGLSTSNPLSLNVDRARTNITAVFASQAGTTMTWNGIGSWDNHVNWTPTGVPGSNDVIVIQSGTSVLGRAFSTINPFLVESGATLVFSNWNTSLTAGHVTIRTNGTLTLPTAFAESQESNRIHVVCTDFTLDAGGKVLADARGYAATNGTGKGLSHSGSNGGGGGGGHGGKGGNSAVKAGGIAYGSTNAPVTPGSGGGNGATGSGGAGGGAVRIEAAGTVAIEGIISANGANGGAGHWGGGGGGSGGSVLITGGAVNTNSGLLQANGGNGGTSGGGFPGGGAGGGRIAVWSGVPRGLMDDYLAGFNTNKVIRMLLCDVFAGAAVTNGTGAYNYPDAGCAESGSAFFFTLPKKQGTIFLIQ